MKITTREEWGAAYGIGKPVPGPWNEVVIHTAAGAVLPGDWKALAAAALTLDYTERQQMRGVERYHAVTRGWGRGGYSFFIFRDGTICEMNGWLRQGVHTQGRNSSALGVCFAGHGDLQAATEAQWLAAEWLIREGIRLGHLTPSPVITGHRDYAPKSCPGALIFPLIGRLRYLSIPNPEGPEMNETETRILTAARDNAAAAFSEANHARAAALVAVDTAKDATTEAHEARELSLIAVDKINRLAIALGHPEVAER
jgi:hypothetical protein